jgi:hypothetical protein
MLPWWGIPLVVLASGLAQAGGPGPAGQIPEGVAWAFVLERPGQAAENVLGLLERFKGINPQLGREALRAKLFEEIGEDLLTPEGMRAWGLDPDGGLALFGTDLEGDPIVLAPLSDPDLFLKKFQAAATKDGQELQELPKPVAGARLLRQGQDTLAVARRHAVLVSGLDEATAAKRIQAALGPGKKLAGQAAFKKAVAGLPPDVQGTLYFDFGRLGKQALADLDERQKDEERYLKSLAPEAQKARKPDLARMREVRKRLAGLLGDFDALALGLALDARSAQLSLFLGAGKGGLKRLGAAFPAAGPPAAYAGLEKTALWSGWAALSPRGMLELVADLPDGAYRSVRDGLAEADRELQALAGQTFVKDLMGNLKEPLSFHLMNPELTDLKAEEPVQQQVLRLIKVAGSCRVADPARLEALFAALAAKAKEAGRPVETLEQDGARLTLFRPEPGLVFGFGLKGDAALIGLGEQALSDLARALPPGGLSTPAQGGLRAAGRLDVAAVSEVLSSAVAKNIGGREGMGFRMLWPMVQQSLGQLAGVEMQASLLPTGLGARLQLWMR